MLLLYCGFGDYSVAAEEELRRKRWRLALGHIDEEEPAYPSLTQEEEQVDDLLENIYPARREGGLQQDRRFSSRWFKDLGEFFKDPVVEVVQQDLVDRLGLTRILKDPDIIDDLHPTTELVTAILTLKDKLPPAAMDSARRIVKKLAEELENKLRFSLINQLGRRKSQGARVPNAHLKDLDWDKTIRANLRHFQPSLNTIIPVRLYGHPKSRRSAKRIIIVVDQSASMLASFIHAAVISSILASIPTLETKLILFDTEVVDLSDEIKDPVALLFKNQLGGGTDIGKALRYAASLTHDRDSYILLISDLYEGGTMEALQQACDRLLNRSVHLLNLLALDDQGQPDYDIEVAKMMADRGISSLACTPDQFPQIISKFLNGDAIGVMVGSTR